ncbi:hypothetical protein [Flavobacterium sp. FlaQc-50]|jgi:hypothetical protein|uniref:hypothetical protein n=1 Tax=unclassified Flavobacterium TaxID=196869 RepID=UPI003756D320
MNNILINNIIQEGKVSINFNLQDGSLSFPTVDLLTSGDIELNPLVIKLTELLELHRKIEITYEDALSLLETDSKIKLVKETLDNIYDSFNLNVIDEDEDF